MAIYRYKSGSLIEEMRLRTNESGGTRAYLFARADATPEQLQQVRAGIDNLGWKALPMLIDGKPALEVRGFKKYNVAAQAIANNGWVVGNPSIELEPDDKRTGRDKVESSTLRLAGGSYVLGDISYMIYANHDFQAGKTEFDKAKNLVHDITSGKKPITEKLLEDAKKISGLETADLGAVAKNSSATLKTLAVEQKRTNFFNRLNIGAGIGYALGSLSLLFYGSRDQSQNTIQSAAKKIQSYAHKEKLEVSTDSALSEASAKRRHTFLGKIDGLLAQYPSEALNTVYVGVGSLLMAAAGYRVVKAHQAGNFARRSEELWDVGLGAMTFSSAAAGLLIKEKKREEGEEKRGGLGGLVDWVREKPLRATGYGFMVATLLHAWGTYKKYTGGDPVVRKGAIWRGAFVGFNVLSEIMLTLSSKGHGVGVKPDESVDQSVIAATADLIHRQPSEKHEQLIGQFAGYMSSREVLGGKAEDIATELSKQVKAMNANPWAKTFVAHDPKINTSTEETAAQAPVPSNATARNVPGTTVANAEHTKMLAGVEQQQVLA